MELSKNANIEEKRSLEKTLNESKVEIEVLKARLKQIDLEKSVHPVNGYIIFSIYNYSKKIYTLFVQKLIHNYKIYQEFQDRKALISTVTRLSLENETFKLDVLLFFLALFF